MTVSAIWSALVVLLYLFWGLAAGAAVTALLPLRICGPFRNAVYLSASRGKLWETRPAGALGRLTDWKVPQQWFGHFYALGLIANVLTIAGISAYCGMYEAYPILPLGMLLLHLVRRCWETCCVLHYPPQAYMHAVAYAFGLVYYAVLPLTLMVSELGHALVCPGRLHRQSRWASLSLGIQGAAIFVLGSLLQNHSHRLLAGLAKASTPGNQSFPYRIPRGGAFEYVSCPHYLGEIVIYFGLALTSNQDISLSWLPLVWVVANLVLAAGQTHVWYKQKFKEYPIQRRALIPFVY